MIDKKKYLMFISYIGSGFSGSQLQLNKDRSITRETIQQVLENGLKFVLQLHGERPVCVHLASRTDKGVHALRAPVFVWLPPYENKFIHSNHLKRQLNAYFSDLRNVRILEVYRVTESFKFSTVQLEKTYMYRIGVLKHEFFHMYDRHLEPITEIKRTYFIRSSESFDLERANKAAQLFEGEKDYGAVLGKPSQNSKPTVCNIKSFKVGRAEPLLSVDPISQRYNYYHFMCRGNKFLFHMVRRMVALTVAAGFCYLDLSGIQKLFDEPVPSSWPTHGVTVVPGFGLYLLNINFDIKDYIEEENQFLENTSIMNNINDKPIVLDSVSVK